LAHKIVKLARFEESGDDKTDEEPMQPLTPRSVDKRAPRRPETPEEKAGELEALSEIEMMVEPAEDLLLPMPLTPNDPINTDESMRPHSELA